MKFNTKAKASIMTLTLLLNSMPVYGATVVTANNTNSLNKNDISIIASNDGESVSKIDSLDSAFSIAFTNDNYITTEFAKVTNPNGDFVPVYSKPSNQSDVLGSIPVDSIVVIGKKEGDFSEIFFEEQEAYIENIHLASSSPEESAPEEQQNNSQDTTQQPKQNNLPTGKYVKITSSTGLNLRQEPSTSSEVLNVIPSGEYADFLENNGDWIKVQYNGKSGYISSQFANITNEKEVAPPPSNSATADNIINFSKKYLGKPYIYGSTNLNVGTDCSGFTYAVFKNFGIKLNRSSRDQYRNGTPVQKSNLLPGDLVFFNTGGKSPISHVGIYLGNNQYIHSTDTRRRGIMISSMNSDYARRTYYGAKRVIN